MSFRFHLPEQCLCVSFNLWQEEWMMVPGYFPRKFFFELWNLGKCYCTTSVLFFSFWCLLLMCLREAYQNRRHWLEYLVWDTYQNNHKFSAVFSASALPSHLGPSLGPAFSWMVWRGAKKNLEQIRELNKSMQEERRVAIPVKEQRICGSKIHSRFLTPDYQASWIPFYTQEWGLLMCSQFLSNRLSSE